MKKIVCIILLCLLLNACSFMESKRPNYAQNLADSDSDNAGSPCVVRSVPLPGAEPVVTSPEELTKTFAVSYDKMFTLVIKALNELDFLILSLNSSTGTVEFSNNSAQKFVVKLTTDSNSSERTVIVFSNADGSLKVNKNTVNQFFNSLNLLVAR